MPNATELCSLAALKAYLQITGAAQDSILQSLKDSVEALVKTYCGRDFLVASYTEYYDGDDGSVLRVSQRPITAITSIHSDPARAYAAGSLIPSTDYLTDDALEWNAGLITLKDYRFLKGKKSTKVVYSAGYATIPADLSHAVKLIAAKEFKVQDKRLAGTLSQQVGDMTMSLEIEAFPKNALEILNRYRRISV